MFGLFRVVEDGFEVVGDVVVLVEVQFNWVGVLLVMGNVVEVIDLFG